MAQVFLNANESYNIGNSNDSVFGLAGSGTEIITIATGVTNTTVNNNTEGVRLNGSFSAFTFQQQGNQLVIYSGGAVVATIGLQFDVNGTLITTTDGTVSAFIVPSTTGGSPTITLGGTTVAAGTTAVQSTTVAPVPALIDATNKTPVVGPVAPVGFTITTGPGALTESAATTLQGPASMTFTVTLSAIQTTATTVTFTTSSGTAVNAATAGSDYATTTGTVTIAAGQISNTFSVPILDDLVFDGTLANPTGVEVFTVTLSAPTAGVLANTTTIGTITDGEVNAQPVNTLPAVAPTALLSTTAAIPGIVVADANNATLTTVVTATNGLLSAPAGGALATAVSGVTSITLTGSIANVNASLAALTYVSSRVIPGVDTLTVLTTDGLGGSASSTVNINVAGGGVFTALANAFTGTAANEFYSGTQADANNAGDTLAAGAGTDTLTLTAVGTGALTPVAFTGLEILNLTTVSGAGATTTVAVATQFDTNLTSINFIDPDAVGNDVLVVSGANTGTTITLNKSVASADFGMTATGTPSLSLVLGGGVVVPTLAAAANSAAILNIVSNGTGTVAQNNVITSLTTGVLATTGVVNISGSQALSLTLGAQPVLTVNGSGATGALTINGAANTLTTAATLSGGLGNDTIIGDSDVANTLNGNAGNDTITGGDKADTINGGAGDDIINGGVGAADVSITGGLGRDTITVNQSGDTVIVAVGDTGTVAANTADVIVGLRDGVRIDLTNYYTGGGFIANGNLVTATTGASATLRDVYINAANKSIVIEMDAAGTTTQEIFIGAGAGATIANVNGILTFGPVPLVASVVSGVVVVEGQNATGANVAVTLATPIPQIGGVNVNGATTSIANLNGSAVSGSNGLTITGSTVANTIVGSSAADIITGGAGADIMTGGAGNDTFVFTTLAFTQSNFSAGDTTAVNIDAIRDFVGNGAAAGDVISILPLSLIATGVTTGAGATPSTAAVTAITVATAGTFTALTAAAEVVAPGTASATGNAGVIQMYDVTVTAGTLAGRYLIINDATAAIAATDTIINLTGITGALNALDFIFV